MTTKLRLYNGALAKLGQRRLSSLTENIEPRRLLDNVYDNGWLRRTLSEGLWNFAGRTVEVSFNPSLSPSFGYRKAFDKPTDFVRTAAISLDEYFNTPLNEFHDEGEYWWCDHETIYVRYISDDSAYGGDLSLWPEEFAEFAECDLAWRVAPNMTAAKATIQSLKEDRAIALSRARGRDASQQAVSFPPRGSFARARGGGFSRGYDRGNRGRFTG